MEQHKSKETTQHTGDNKSASKLDSASDGDLEGGADYLESDGEASHASVSPIDEEVLSEEGGVVRAENSKVALRGLKVVGKIDLPTPKEKGKEAMDSIPPPEADKVSTTPSRTRKRRSSHKRLGQKPRSRSQQQPERELDAEKHKRTNKEKAHRKQHYDQKISDYQFPVKPLKKRDTSNYEVYREEDDIPNTNWFGRLLRWFKGG